MAAIFKYNFILLFCLATFFAVGQNQILQEAQTFIVKGKVEEKRTYQPIPKVNIEVNGGGYTKTDSNGEFRIQVKIGDELAIRHKDFETVYYTIVSQDRILVQVEPVSPSLVSNRYQKRDFKAFKQLIDSANVYAKQDAEKAIQFVTEALKESYSVNQSAEAYETLADIYKAWKQYDLAVSNYRISLQNQMSNEVQLKLGDAYRLNKNYQESLDVYGTIDLGSLQAFQKVVYYEGLGDTYYGTKAYTKAIENYKKGLGEAQTHLITPKVTDLSSKIAQAYNSQGEVEKAKKLFDNSLNLASKENKKRAVEEKITVAEFNSENQNYSDEIKLRKEALDDISDIQLHDSIIDNESALTPQKQNYKIGNAYFLQKDFDSAISYLERSIKEADDKEDLVVKKDATRKLSDVYADAGDFDKARKTFEEYTAAVDELYIKKEQEISQLARFNRSIIEKQNRINSLESDRQLSESKYQLSNERNKRQQLIIYSLVFGVVLLLVTAYFMFKYIKQQRLANNLLALKSLRSQMNPHFIFNALNSVNSFIALNDERTANKYLSDFSYLMRAVLENSEEDFIPLQKEIELLELYTKLEHFRFKDKFDYSITVDDRINVGDYKIPPMLLQPYIENAVWHGLRYKNEKGHLSIAIDKVNEDEICITIADDGIGRERSKALKTERQQQQKSKGMDNIKKRISILNDMYKDKIDVRIEDFQQEEDSGTKVVVTLKKD
ncbi:histidine kinase [Mangrovimonas sp. YM274]|uniref:tetratricopeptide repeat-containing sensor histidine kinase n=1 Tax=Mangrovimonas sp. YM274 TaxID=3070660 RepID=UPI0027DD7069|nr:histidine kinase [Mangrovimonas sp. YM274]WMI69426.1 histidine kinase [Mangrovimonas sp. YM274]